MRTQWIERFSTTIASRPVKPGVWRRQDGGFVIRARVRDPRTGKDREIRRILAQATLDEAVTQLTKEKLAIAEGRPESAPVKIRLHDYAESLFEKKVRTGEIRSAATRYNWAIVIKKLAAKLGDLYMSELPSLNYVFVTIAARLGLPKKNTPRGMRRTSKDLLRISGASQIVAMAINGHHTEQMHNHYSTVNEGEIREVLGRTTELMGLVPGSGPTGAKTGVKDASRTGEKQFPRRSVSNKRPALKYSTGVLKDGQKS